MRYQPASWISEHDIPINALFVNQSDDVESLISFLWVQLCVLVALNTANKAGSYWLTNGYFAPMIWFVWSTWWCYKIDGFLFNSLYLYSKIM